MEITKIKSKIRRPFKSKREKLLQTLITKLMQAIKKIHSGQNFPFGDFTLTHQQIMILFFIAKHKRGVIVKDLANFLQVTPGAITQFTDVLVSYKLVCRERTTDDRRLTKIKLSPAAQIKFKKFKNDYLFSASQAFENLTINELQEFIRLIEKITIKDKG